MRDSRERHPELKHCTLFKNMHACFESMMLPAIRIENGVFQPLFRADASTAPIFQALDAN
jgi:hypothetical protein